MKFIFGNLKKQQVLFFLADTFAMIVFTTAVGMGIEVGISGLSFFQSLRVRITAIPVNLITARPYGVFRDWIFKKLKATQGSQLQKGIADVVAFILFQAPLYAMILMAAGGAIRMQVLSSVATTAVFMLVAGRPYGLFLGFSRRLFGVGKEDGGYSKK
jgi:hypothetical protein